MQYISKSESDTLAIAHQIARGAKKGDIYALYGTLGAGKTVFAKGFITALAPQTGEVPSPTFTLLQTYETPDFEVYHFDMYRLKKPLEAYEIGIEDAFAEGVSLIEWPEKITGVLPKKHIAVTFEIRGDDRIITTSEKE
jgi:tRNA threonylcarbamoyladenosine biosynthesis protein TsaE